MGEIFDGMSLEELAGSENPIIDASQQKVESSKKSDEKKEEKNEKTEPVIVSGVDLEQLAELDEPIGTIENNGNNDDEVGINGTKKTSQTPAKKDDGSSPSSQDTFTSLASALVEAGVFSSITPEEISEVKTVEQLLGALAKQVQADRYKDLNEDQKAYLEALENGVPQDEFATRKANAEQYKVLEDDKIRQAPALQKELIRRSFIIKGFSSEEADKFATLSVAQPNGAEDAIKAKSALIAFETKQIEEKVEKAKKDKADSIEKEKVALGKLKSKVEETSEIVPGIKVNSPTKTKIFESMTTAVNMAGDKPLNEVMDSYSKNEDYKMRLHAMHVLTKGFTDFSKFTQTKTTSAVSQFEKLVTSTGTGSSGSSTGVQTRISTGETANKIAEQLSKINF